MKWLWNRVRRARLERIHDGKILATRRWREGEIIKVRMAKLSSTFDVEREMWIPATRWLTEQNLGYKREFRVPWGICDLVGVGWSHERVSNRRLRRQKTPIGPPGRVALLQRVPDEQSGRSITIDELCVTFMQSPDWVTREVKSLISGNFVKRHSDGSLTSSVSWAPLHTCIVAVELKLDRIDEAISQARSHVAFATESYVGFPTTVADRIMSSHHADILRAAGVGLLSVTNSGVTVMAEPVMCSSILRDHVLQMHCVERFWPQIEVDLTVGSRDNVGRKSETQ